jgi:hypothetical protein
MTTQSNTPIRTRNRVTLAVLGGLITLATVVIIIAPPEQTLGNDVKLVFIHGALLLSGMLGFYAAALFGLGALFTAREDVIRWAQVVLWVAFVMYVGGILVSLPASSVIWGNIFLAEPRMQVAMNNTALALILLTAVGLLKNVRVRGALIAAFAVFLAYSTYTAPMVLHPANPIGSSPSWGIRLSFGALLLVCLAAAGWMVVRMRSSDASRV